MTKKSGLRGWHTWWSVALAAPIMIVSVTAIFIAHDKSLALKEIPVAADWLPGYAATPAMMPELRAIHRGPDGREHVATNYGLFVRSGDRVEPIEALGKTDIRTLTQAGDTLLAAGKTGVWALRGGAWEQLLRGDAWSAGAAPDGTLVAAIKDRGALMSSDGGRTWQIDDSVRQGLATYASGLTAQPLTLHKLVMDLHTGKAFFGKEYEWLWIDIVGAAMAFLTASGLVMWWRARRQKRLMAEAAGAPKHQVAATP